MYCFLCFGRLMKAYASTMRGGDSIAIVIRGESTPYYVMKDERTYGFKLYKPEYIQEGTGYVNVLCPDYLKERPAELFSGSHSVLLKSSLEEIDDLKWLCTEQFPIIDFDVNDEETPSYGKRNPRLYKAAVPYVVVCLMLRERGYTPVLRTTNPMVVDLARLQGKAIIVDTLPD